MHLAWELLLVSYFACSEPAPPHAGGDSDAEVEPDTGMVDAIPDAPAAPDGAVRVETPDIIAEPYSDVIWCFLGSFPDREARIAIDYAAMYEHPTFGHHIQFNGIRDGAGHLDLPDGSLVDCSDAQETMLATQQILSLNKVVGDGLGGQMVLPEGMAVPVEPGARWLLEYHVVNPTGRRVRTRGILDLRETDPANVDTWASAWTFNRSGFELPPGEATTVTVDCSWPQDATVFAIMGHMHERGRSMSVDAVAPDGSTQRIYDVPEWVEKYRYAPLISDLGGGFSLLAGTRFVTSCDFFNDTSHSMTFPEEMCVSTGLFAPAEAPIFCDTDTDTDREEPMR